VDNPVSISFPGVDCKDLKPVISEGAELIRDTACGRYIIRVNVPTLVRITAEVMINGRMDTINNPVVFRVKSLPEPKASLLSAIGDGDLTAEHLLTAKRLYAKIVNADFEINTKVTSFVMTVVSGQKKQAFKNTLTNDLTPEMKAVIRTLKPEDQLIFSEIKAMDQAGKAGELEPLTITIIPSNDFIVSLNGMYGTPFGATQAEILKATTLRMENPDMAGCAGAEVVSYNCYISEIGSTDLTKYVGKGNSLTAEIRKVFTDKKGLYDIEFKEIRIKCVDGKVLAGKDIWIRLVEKH
jgi:hypothetical protein